VVIDEMLEDVPGEELEGELDAELGEEELDDMVLELDAVFVDADDVVNTLEDADVVVNAVEVAVEEGLEDDLEWNH
jgi:hypothetical protein